MGVFSDGSNRSIFQNSSFWDTTEPTHGGNDITITVATMALQYAASIDSVSSQ